MKKIAIAVIAILFLGSVYVGFRAAAQMNERILSNNKIVEVSFTSAQKNYLIIHVSALTGEAPFLVSVWGLFINFSDQPHLAFVPLYPAGDEETTHKLSSAFALRKDQTITDRLVSRLEREYDIETDGYFLLDNFAVSSLLAWLNMDSVSLPQSEPQSWQEYQLVLSHEQQSFATLCRQFQEGGIRPVLDKIQWTVLLPDHFATNLTFETLTYAVDKLEAAGVINSCDVLSNQ